MVWVLIGLMLFIPWWLSGVLGECYAWSKCWDINRGFLYSSMFHSIILGPLSGVCAWATLRDLEEHWGGNPHEWLHENTGQDIRKSERTIIKQEQFRPWIVDKKIIP